MSALRWSSHFSYSDGVTARTWAVMFAWLRPHSSAHCPVNVVPAYLAGILNHV